MLLAPGAFEKFWPATLLSRPTVAGGSFGGRQTGRSWAGALVQVLCSEARSPRPEHGALSPPGATPTAASVLPPPGRPFPPHNRQGCAPATNRPANGTGRSVYHPTVTPIWSVRPCPGMNEVTSADVSGAGGGLGT